MSLSGSVNQNILSREAMGARLRLLRKQRGFTLKTLSEACGVATSTLSKAELGQTALGYEKFVAISMALNVDMSDLLQAGGGLNTTSPLDGQVLKVSSADLDEYSTDHYLHKFLFSETSGKAMIPLLVTIYSRSMDEFEEYVRHPGEEFVYVLSGAIRIVFENGTDISLSRTEAAYFDSSVGHVYLSTSKTPARVLAVCTDRPE